MLNYDLIYHMPGFLAAWNGVEPLLEDRQTVVISVGSRQQRHLISDLVRSASSGRRTLDVLEVSEFHGVSPLKALAQLYSMDWLEESLTDLKQLFENAFMPQRILLGGFEDLPLGEVAEWGVLVNQWSHLAACGVETPELLLVASVGSSVEQQIARSGCWQVTDWSSLPTDLEIQLVVELSANASGASIPRRIWQQHLLPSLCGRDWDLMDHLWDAIVLERGRIFSAIREYAEERNWTKEKAQELYGSQGASLSSFLGSGSNHGLHPAAALLLGHEAVVDQMIWEGQMKAVYPLLNRVRFHIAQTITEQLGDDSWPLRVKWEDDFESADCRKGSTAEFRVIRDILYAESELASLREQYGEIVSLGRDLRNDLAHHGQVSYQRFEEWFNKVHESGAGLIRSRLK